MQGFVHYFRFILRRERFMSLVWFICIAGSAVGFSAMYPSMFPDEQSMLAMSVTMDTPAMVAMMGPVYGLDSLSNAIIMSQECLIWFAMATVIMNIFFINRHTRADEELGRHEMLRALPVGRLTGVVAAFSGAAVLNGAITLATALGLIAMNIDGTTVSGSFAYALSIGIQGLLFAALTLLAAQILSTSRGVSGAMFALLGVFYVMRMSGDMNGNILSFLSPMGLGLKVQPFYTDDFTPLAVILLESIIILIIALTICARRDSGNGVIPAQKGRSHASCFLQGEFGLAWRLSRNGFFAWSAGMLTIGLTYGSVISTIDQFVADNDMLRQMLEVSGAASITDSYAAMVISISALLVSVPVISSVSKLRGEEKRGRLEQILAKSVPRSKIFLSYILLAFIESFVLLILTAAGFYAAAGNLDFGMLLKSTLVYLPAIWVMLGLTILLIGLLPKLTGFVWVLFAYAFVIYYFGTLLDVPEWALKLSPFGSIPQLPMQELTFVPLCVLTAIAAGLMAGGMAAFRQRDITN